MQKYWLPVTMIAALISIILIPTVSHGYVVKREPSNDVHRIYARDAQPYANLLYDTSLPFIPRYRYPVRQYYGKRNGGMYYGKGYNPAMYDDDSEWSPFQYDSRDIGLSKRPFKLTGASDRIIG